MNYQASLMIDGVKRSGEAGPIEVVNPATGCVFSTCPGTSSDQLDQAVTAAENAFRSWQNVPDGEIQSMLSAIADRIEANASELAEMVVWEQGKPLALAQMEVGGAVAWTRYAADLTIPVKVIEDSDARLAELHRKPLGVVGSVTPWNWPLMIAVWHIMPALRTRNTVVIKPASLTPFSTLRLVEIINEVVPPGVVNSVTGDAEIGGAMSAHPGISKIVFTGSTPTGKAIMRNAADTLKRLTLELGGNDAGIVLDDADLDEITEAIFQASFINMGQTCAALKRLYVHVSLYEELVQRLAVMSTEQGVGSGFDPANSFGPVQNLKQLNYLEELVDDAQKQGARVVCGGKRLPGEGYFYPPTIVADISDGTRLVDEEQFGPVLPIIRYTDIDEVIERANDNPNGLGGSIWGSDVERAKALALRIEAGTVWINNHAEVLPHCPFGGCKKSGIGVEFGEEGLLEYTYAQLVNLNRGGGH
ncbi:aldehyde dehydrogenase family protein [Marinobacter sp. UBA2688]|uniref:aldehyde dehydrogenase family protein n=1 Tax=Marinobacter sp. UBA2688 TaxID=1946816 RepID=UPI002580CE98|nr:aldehyde dehydrogenase family protein [Marinobacter sp. UBA2688]|tara:strand:- start:24793 stop:26217 length:1425 start_codon:yes stop_codon:yes gene_type:complete